MIRHKTKRKICPDLSISKGLDILTEDPSTTFFVYDLLSTTPFEIGTLSVTVTVDGLDYGSFEWEKGTNVTVSSATYIPGANTITNPMTVLHGTELTDSSGIFPNSALGISTGGIISNSVGLDDTVHPVVLSFYICDTLIFQDTPEAPLAFRIKESIAVYEGTYKAAIDNIGILYITDSELGVYDYIETIDKVEVFSYDPGGLLPDIKMAEMQGSDLVIDTLQVHTGLVQAFILDPTQFVPSHRAPKPFTGALAAQLAWDNLPLTTGNNSNLGDQDIHIWSMYHITFGHWEGGNKMLIHYNNGRTTTTRVDVKFGNTSVGYGRGFVAYFYYFPTYVANPALVTCPTQYDFLAMYTPAAGFTYQDGSSFEYNIAVDSVPVISTGMLPQSYGCSFIDPVFRAQAGFDYITIACKTDQSLFTSVNTLYSVIGVVKLDKSSDGTVDYELTTEMKVIKSQSY